MLIRIQNPHMNSIKNRILREYVDRNRAVAPEVEAEELKGCHTSNIVWKKSGPLENFIVVSRQNV